MATEIVPALQGAEHTGTSPLPSAAEAADRLVAAVGAWASRSHRQNGAIEGFRLLNVLRIHARPIYNLRAIDDEVDRLGRLANNRLLNVADPASWRARNAAYRAADEAARDVYAAVMRDVYDVFQVITGVSAESIQGLNLRVPFAQIAEAARTLAVAS
ncbi:hypothetical protein [Streptomyces chartreusis]|uniref:hypothetical protein n=1 Tax=Streptomyces chartreusis TaxID=1969 RepID=UPI00123DCC2A|nr:hypothetical protein [Streptomyces chartreusis]QEV66242.1 hypothetical protein CP983_05895 [Streptomyces chartreusis]GGW98886.1 hypothetical protein GCM10010321_11680 [Streptomyces chartreusis]